MLGTPPGWAVGFATSFSWAGGAWLAGAHCLGCSFYVGQAIREVRCVEKLLNSTLGGVLERGQCVEDRETGRATMQSEYAFAELMVEVTLLRMGSILKFCKMRPLFCVAFVVVERLVAAYEVGSFIPRFLLRRRKLGACWWIKLLCSGQYYATLCSPFVVNLPDRVAILYTGYLAAG